MRAIDNERDNEREKTIGILEKVKFCKFHNGWHHRYIWWWTDLYAHHLIYSTWTFSLLGRPCSCRHLLATCPLDIILSSECHFFIRPYMCSIIVKSYSCRVTNVPIDQCNVVFIVDRILLEPLVCSTPKRLQAGFSEINLYLSRY